jgi:hypothetical protein
MNSKPRRVKAKVVRVVTEIVDCILDKNGDVEEICEVLEELDYDVDSVEIKDVRSYH